MLTLNSIYPIIFLALLLSACEQSHPVSEPPEIKSSFDQPFPKRGKNLVLVLGGMFSVLESNDTIHYLTSFDTKSRESMIIKANTKDTVFKGKVAQYRGLYYFNKKLNDTSYWIYAVEIKDATIRGLHSERDQMMAWDKKLSKDQEPAIETYSKMIKSIDSMCQHIRLMPDKRMMRKFYESIIDQCPVQFLVKPTESKPLYKDSVAKDRMDSQFMRAKKMELVAEVFPNPALENVTIQLNKMGDFAYTISDMKGNALINGSLSDLTHQVDVSELRSGAYVIQIYSDERDELKSIKLIKK